MKVPLRWKLKLQPELVLCALAILAYMQTFTFVNSLLFTYVEFWNSSRWTDLLKWLSTACKRWFNAPLIMDSTLPLSRSRNIFPLKKAFDSCTPWRPLKFRESLLRFCGTREWPNRKKAVAKSMLIDGSICKENSICSRQDASLFKPRFPLL